MLRLRQRLKKENVILSWESGFLVRKFLLILDLLTIKLVGLTRENAKGILKNKLEALYIGDALYPNVEMGCLRLGLIINHKILLQGR